MSERNGSFLKENLPWLILIPVVLVAAVLIAYLITSMLSDEDGNDTVAVSEQNQAVQLEIDQKQELVYQYEGMLVTDASDIVALKGLGDAYLEIGLLQNEAGDVNGSFRSYKSAVDNYRKYLQQMPDDADVAVDLGYTYSNLFMFDIAVRELESATAMAPDNQRAWHVYGVVLNQIDMVDEAVISWQKSYEIDPNTSIGQESKLFLDQVNTPGTPGTQP